MSWNFPRDRQENRKMLLAAVADVRDALADGADEAEQIATLPESVVRALDDSGLLAMKLPVALGGAEADPVTQLEVIEEVTRIDPSAGWCTMIGASALAIPAAFLPDEGVAEMFPGGNVPRAAGALMPTGKATPADGGYTVSGRWSYASGIRHSQWVSAAALINRDGEGPAQLRMVTFPTSQVKIHDNWQVAGLKGTGSCDFSVSNLFVPEIFTYDLLGGQPKRGGPVYRMGIPGSIAHEHAAFALGVARRALDTVLDQAHYKRRGYRSPPLLAERPSFQRDMGECDLRLRAARALVIEILEEAWEAVCREGVVAPRLQEEIRSSALFATDAAIDIVSLAFRHGGASAVFLSSILQRCLRDIYAAAQHLMMNDSAYENHGQFVLGLPDADPLG